ncbi:pyrrolysyl-tRNA synthetase [Desulfosporosinus sp. HMP52]|uniref:pyrrolysine--tRNA(Pyl) ligase small subunit n=1 Tax=Desulfosporosinus sp. HMP52 TaxID=1487923 RepID=UPI00051FC2F7|nr:pyrrolysine--tRNA(Pyl) ligase small subunit [Desulfosporosinus sp. HMP52]KGK88344.1 pyrrolysyl-tRNA synthetase [Desulfosporosinus sp. HMP52]
MNQKIKEAKKQKVVRYIFKNQRLFLLINKVKLWPSRSGTLHGVKSIENRGKTMVVTTHCGESFVVWDSKNSRSARWLRNRWCKNPCKKCKIPEWKLTKYSQTVFTDTRR